MDKDKNSDHLCLIKNYQSIRNFHRSYADFLDMEYKIVLLEYELKDKSNFLKENPEQSLRYTGIRRFLDADDQDTLEKII